MKVLKWIGIVLAIFVIVVIAWGGFVEPRFLLEQTEYEVEIPNLPAEWEGKRIAFLADLQVGMWFDNLGMVRKVVQRVLEIEPDLVLIGGDFVYEPNDAVIDEVVDLMRPLTRNGAFVIAVLGNHDYSLMHRDSQARREIAETLERKLEEIGIVVLQNESVDLGSGEPLFLAGIGSEWAENSEPNHALAEIPDDAARMIVMHNPVTYRDLPPFSGPLTVAGHTHGGQIRVPGFDSESWLDIARPREVVADGWAEDDIGAEGNRLYVNRGIGFSKIPVRFMCRPELTLFTLRQAKGTVPERNPD